MTRERSLFDEIREGLEAYRDRPEALRQRELPAPDAKTVRKHFGLSQSQMAAFLNVSKRTLENWEQGAVIRPDRRGPCSGSWNWSRAR